MPSFDSDITNHSIALQCLRSYKNKDTICTVHKFRISTLRRVRGSERPNICTCVLRKYVYDKDYISKEGKCFLYRKDKVTEK